MPSFKNLLPHLMKFLAALALILFAVPALADNKDAAKGAHEASIDEVDALMKKNKDLVVLDVRTKEEYTGDGHLPGAKLVDFLDNSFTKSVEKLGLDKNKPVVVYCAVGGRAKRAADKMIELGFKEIILPKGSFNAWKAAGKTVEK